MLAEASLTHKLVWNQVDIHSQLHTTALGQSCNHPKMELVIFFKYQSLSVLLTLTPGSGAFVIVYASDWYFSFFVSEASVVSFIDDRRFLTFLVT